LETFELKNGKPTITKDPEATLDYTENWTDWLAAADTPADTITTATVATASLSVTVDSVSHDTTHVTAWVSGGVPGETAALVYTITTAGGRIDERTLYLKIKDR
jgi:hypothetical protein